MSKREIPSMTRFRFHRGGLDASMATTVPCTTLEELEAIIEKARSFGPKTTGVDVKFYGYDARIDWHCYIVTSDIGVVGFTDGPLPTKRIEARGEKQK